MLIPWIISPKCYFAYWLHTVTGPAPCSHSRSQPVSTASRGQALLVFEHMDRDKNGKVTAAEFEEAAISVGFSEHQAKRMFSR